MLEPLDKVVDMIRNDKLTVGQRFEKIVAGEPVDGPMVAIFNTAPFLNSVAGVPLKDYYTNPKVMLEVQLAFQDRFPDFFCFPGIWADHGALCEPSAFGCPIKWPEGGLPMALPAVSSMSEAAAIKTIDPKKDGFLPQALDEYRFMWDNLPRRYIEEYGYLEGTAMSFGPVELAAVVIGYENFYLNLLLEPEAIHELLKVTTESVIKWLSAIQEINGPLKRLGLADHIPGQVAVEQFEEFWLPYSNKVVEAFPDALVFYHNEFPIRYLGALRAFKADVFHFGGAVEPAKEALGDRITLMGNLDPVNLLLKGSPEEIRTQALASLKQGWPGGRFLLSSGGGLSPDTPAAGLEAMAGAIEEYRRLSG